MIEYKGSEMDGTDPTNNELPAVVIACAAADRDTLMPALKQLSTSARLSRISGMQRSEARAKHVVKRCGLDATYVVVRSENLDSDDVQRALTGLRNEGVEAARLVVAELVTGSPLSIVPTVRAAIRSRVGSGADATTPAAGDPDETQPFSPTPEQLRRRAEKARAISRGEETVAQLDTASRVAIEAAAAVPRTTPQRGRLGVVAALGVALIATAAALAASGVDAPSESVASASVVPELEVVDEAPAPVVEDSKQAQPAPEPIVAAPVVDPEPEPELVLEDSEPATVDVHAAIMAGLRSRELRAYDGLVFTAQPLMHEVHYVRASAYCRNYEMSGLDDWRLPTAGELASLAQVADFGRRDRVWSSTSGAHGKVLTYDVRKDELVMKERTWRHGRVICVRDNATE